MCRVVIFMNVHQLAGDGFRSTVLFDYFMGTSTYKIKHGMKTNDVYLLECEYAFN